MTIQEYLEVISRRFLSGISREHSYRGDLEALIRELVPGIEITNEPANVTDCGNPDYVITKGKIPVGYIEAKDIGKDLNSKSYKEQFKRYKNALDNLIITDYIWFQFFQEGELVHEIRIGEIENNAIIPKVENFSKFENLIIDFSTHIGQTIKSSKKLAEMMAGKARLLQDILERAITSDEITQENTSLKGQYDTFKEILIHDLKPKGFADIYAQTLAYGMFAARLHDPTLNDFSRQEAAELIPKSNPFLRKLFGYVAGPDIDERIKTVVDNLADVFRATNVEQLLKNFGKSTQTHDPIIHFYETFLAEYDPKLRKSRGVWYTPEPVVNFIVRAVDDVLKTEFDLPQGLADTSKTKIKVNSQTPDKRSATGYKQIEKEVHKVQILDPATGTGTFLAEVVKFIYNKNFKSMQGAWSGYVDEHLIPRLNGFELLMASYAMAHLKLDMLLTETGYKSTKNQRLNVYLTNSLEEHHKDTGTLFSNWLSTEANEANHIKRDTPVMCVIGNPPYAVSSSNKGKWIESLTSDYKRDLNERNIQPLSDDYIKFIRYGQHFIDKNGSGVLAYISNNSFIDGIIHRQMRKNLLESFDKIYILDLHGNAKKKEVCPDGSRDQNVFDIMQGVSINIFIKTGKKKSNQLGKVFHSEAYGTRDIKYPFLLKNDISSIKWKILNSKKPHLFYVPKNFEGKKSYEKGFKLELLFITNACGMVTARDSLLIKFTKNGAEKLISDFELFDEKEFRTFYKLKKDSRDWTYLGAKNDINANAVIRNVDYRPFDKRFVPYSPSSKATLSYPRNEVMQHMLKLDNVALAVCKQQSTFDFQHVFVVNSLTDKCTISSQTKEASYHFPLYLCPETDDQETLLDRVERTPNLKPEIVDEIAEKLGLTFTPEKFPSSGGVPDRAGWSSGVPDRGWSSGVPDRAGWSSTMPDRTKRSSAVPERRGGRNTKNYMKLPYNPKLKQRARELRKAENLSEVLFWNQVKNKQFRGFDFDRQKIIGNYIVDFYCTNCDVVIEIDGSSHDDKQEYDARRDAYLESLGLTVIHIPVVDVMKNMSGVMEMLYDHAALAGSDHDHPALSGTPPEEGNFAPIDILDYIYAVLHSPTYREKYKEFLKIDFPRVPYPKDQETFWKLVKLGGEIRQIHLLESPKVEEYITSYPQDGDNVVTRRLTKSSIGYEAIDKEKGRVWINDEQYFENVPLIAWEFYIGGYQPAKKWLKDRRDRELKFEDILHYQKIIVALTETDRIMKEIDTIEIE